MKLKCILLVIFRIIYKGTELKHNNIFAVLFGCQI